jgi:hypothetical protein
MEFGENVQKLQSEYDNAKIIWDSKLRNMERQGRQELQMTQRNAATDKKKLESTIAHLEMRVNMLEEVINSAEEPADTHADVDEDGENNASSPKRTSLTVAIDDGSASNENSPQHASFSDDGSPAFSPTDPANAKLILQLQEENQKLADAKLKAQLRYENFFPSMSLWYKSLANCMFRLLCVHQPSSSSSGHPSYACVQTANLQPASTVMQSPKRSSTC